MTHCLVFHFMLLFLSSLFSSSLENASLHVNLWASAMDAFRTVFKIYFSAVQAYFFQKWEKLAKSDRTCL